ncbi:hypothetical protein AK812_SmicGene24909 [Symbiodinium microadriaticum]|uniref:Uncharacterized protein n=1 Tax=Symbiodinium microadriaticum TaxID=2951 RepID=A0A1Q9DDC7_SYMMI|nr:hypothetical protein AK812_SmicGene24909 [Symbiodinium microadriaticum]
MATLIDVTIATMGNGTQSGRSGLRERSPAPAVPRGGAASAASQKPKPAFSLQTGLVAVIVFAVLAASGVVALGPLGF